MKNIKRSAALIICLAFMQIMCIVMSAAKSDTVYLGGMPFGVRFYTGKLTVNGFGEVDGAGGAVSPAKDAGLCENDIILKIDEKKVESVDDVTGAVTKSGGKELKFTVSRSSKELVIPVTPVLSESMGEFRIGLWLKDGTAGIGTVTYVIPKTGAFGGLGHGICDGSNGKLCDISKGIVSEVTINGVKIGKSGDPGELKGIFTTDKSGTVSLNTDHGVFGVLSDPKEYCGTLKEIKIGTRDDLHEGDAVIYCTVDDAGICEYDVKIRPDSGSDSPGSSFMIEVCDQNLIEKTGGIVQGMSGSPIVQDGVLVGAVTHVLISDPTRGYGIYIDAMLDCMPDVLK